MQPCAAHQAQRLLSLQQRPTVWRRGLKPLLLRIHTVVVRGHHLQKYRYLSHILLPNVPCIMLTGGNWVIRALSSFP